MFQTKSDFRNMLKIECVYIIWYEIILLIFYSLLMLDDLWENHINWEIPDLNFLYLLIRTQVNFWFKAISLGVINAILMCMQGALIISLELTAYSTNELQYEFRIMICSGELKGKQLVTWRCFAYD